MPPAPTPAIDASEHLDHEAMLAAVTWLAHDDRRGRYSLSPNIEESARWLQAQYTASGIAPVGSSYRHDFSIVVGAAADGEPSFALRDAQGRATVAADALAVRTQGSPGVASGEVVFVGYAGLGYREQSDDSDRVAYDALADVDLRGKIALVFEGRPGRADYRSIRRALQAIEQSHDSELAKLQSRYHVEPNADNPAKSTLPRGYTRARARLEKHLRNEVARAYGHYMAASALSDEYWQTEAAVESLRIELKRQWKLAHPLDFSWRDHRLSRKLARIHEKGAIGAIVVRGPQSLSPADPDIEAREQLPALARAGVVRSPVAMPVLQLAAPDAARVFASRGFDLPAAQIALDAADQPQSRVLAGVTAEFRAPFVRTRAEVPNILAMIPGSDLAEEVVVVGAHYDHIGDHTTGDCHPIRNDAGEIADGICNGADDNATGTALLVQMAQTFARTGVSPRRTIVLMHFAGEELGLLGSHAVVEKPPMDLDKVVAMVNVDMIGRISDAGLSISGIETSPQWRPLIDAIGGGGLPLLLDGAITSRSDHVGFYRRKVPVLFYFTGVHDDYHRPSDETHRLNLAGMRTISELIVRMVQRLGDGAPIPWSDPAPRYELGPALPGENPDSILERIPGMVPPGPELP